MKTIVIATRNRGKAREYCEMFQSRGIQVETLDAFPQIGKIKETGRSFKENAMIKASTVVHQLGIPSLADDSGLEVRAIHNEPGIYSARYAGDHDDLANQRKLLSKLSGVDDRRAQFVTCLVLLKPNGQRLVVYGKLSGEILQRPRGQNGFGYDPLFYVPAKGLTLAQMTMDQKDAISHRGIAARKMMQHFDRWWHD